ncbi:hypothetical protein ACFOG5_16670 [Pedobacter fastidiosus]|uniref:hypothetical protein n=1 Tax=Pedobacter fastidiosus TaxID=2765361 RepID=UPI00361737BA
MPLWLKGLTLFKGSGLGGFVLSLSGREGFQGQNLNQVINICVHLFLSVVKFSLSLCVLLCLFG